MTRDEAQRLVQAFFRAQGSQSEGLNAKGLGLVQVGVEQLGFEHQADRGALRCAALIYRFRAMPKPAVLEALRAEVKAGTDTGGGELEYEAQSRALFLTRTYDQAVPEARLVAELNRLLEACRVWREEVAPRAAERAFKNVLR